MHRLPRLHGRKRLAGRFVFAPGSSRHTEIGTFLQVKRHFAALRCNHCTAAPCVTSCPFVALHKRPHGIVDLDCDACIGCNACTATPTCSSPAWASASCCQDHGGQFTVAAGFPGIRDIHLAAAAGDIDGDGDADILVGSSPGSQQAGSDGQPRLFVNQDVGLLGRWFAEQTPVRLPAVRATTTAMVPVDVEGGLDAVIGNSADGVETGQTILFVNDGRGRFRVAASANGIPGGLNPKGSLAMA